MTNKTLLLFSFFSLVILYIGNCGYKYPVIEEINKLTFHNRMVIFRVILKFTILHNIFLYSYIIFKTIIIYQNICILYRF